MSADVRARNRKAAGANNLYTVVLGLAFAIVLATTALVAYTCYFQYGTVFKVP